MEPKYKKANLCYIETETKFDTSYYEIYRPKGKNKNVIGLMKNVIVEKIVLESATWRQKTCSYLNNDDDKNKKAK